MAVLFFFYLFFNFCVEHVRENVGTSVDLGKNHIGLFTLNWAINIPRTRSMSHWSFSFIVFRAVNMFPGFSVQMLTRVNIVYMDFLILIFLSCQHVFGIFGPNVDPGQYRLNLHCYWNVFWAVNMFSGISVKMLTRVNIVYMDLFIVWQIDHGAVGSRCSRGYGAGECIWVGAFYNKKWPWSRKTALLDHTPRIW